MSASSEKDREIERIKKEEEGEKKSFRESILDGLIEHIKD